jgi:hypothetical protein
LHGFSAARTTVASVDAAGVGGFAIGVAPELGVVASLLAGIVAVTALITKIVIVGTAADAALVGSGTAAIVGLGGRREKEQPEGKLRGKAADKQG